MKPRPFHLGACVHRLQTEAGNPANEASVISIAVVLSWEEEEEEEKEDEEDKEEDEEGERHGCQGTKERREEAVMWEDRNAWKTALGWCYERR